MPSVGQNIVRRSKCRPSVKSSSVVQVSTFCCANFLSVLQISVRRGRCFPLDKASSAKLYSVTRTSIASFLQNRPSDEINGPIKSHLFGSIVHRCRARQYAWCDTLTSSAFFVMEWRAMMFCLEKTRFVGCNTQVELS